MLAKKSLAWSQFWNRGGSNVAAEDLVSALETKVLPNNKEAHAKTDKNNFLIIII
ncbi:hypothetical protein ZPR_3706 [Zunongwangia profunda SM-A87]|uniref:Uncharacterized protein n=1 Tax=Zunongwangia profunda (strain DSM 18752 / CCTCC AB 206139 / SM-A87) TaxID=655815 RepID=D5BL90_ZUNPS|nr:hypothetical protein ZPR_3706 [Zunongwangia profunda SM-A87]|tara:strand:+ start:533 stop:697 length:165 start_codon:yes stop_codon:yes gene_type:complete